MVQDQVRVELESLGAPRREPGLCAIALTLAARLDDAAPRDSAALAGQLRETLLKIKASCRDAQPVRGRLDDLASRRAARAAGTKDPQRSPESEHGGS